MNIRCGTKNPATSKMRLLEATVKGQQPLTIVANNSIQGVKRFAGSSYDRDYFKDYLRQYFYCQYKLPLKTNSKNPSQTTTFHAMRPQQIGFPSCVKRNAFSNIAKLGFSKFMHSRKSVYCDPNFIAKGRGKSFM